VIECLAAALVALMAGVTMGARMVRRKVAVVTVVGPSMEPTLNAGDRVLIRRVTDAGLRTGQIVVFVTPPQDETAFARQPRWPPCRSGWMIKRVAATAGEPAPAIMLTTLVGPAEPVVPPGQLAVLGDNLARSLDSRHLGYIPAERVLGRMIRSMPAGRSAG
jgi:signal peptidase I